MGKKFAFSTVAATAWLCLFSVAWSADKATEKFLKEAIEGNLAEVQIGELAQQQGESEAVRSFGKQLATDHGNANQNATAIAAEVGVTPRTSPVRNINRCITGCRSYRALRLTGSSQKRWLTTTRRTFEHSRRQRKCQPHLWRSSQMTRCRYSASTWKQPRRCSAKPSRHLDGNGACPHPFGLLRIGHDWTHRLGELADAISSIPRISSLPIDG